MDMQQQYIHHHRHQKTQFIICKNKSIIGVVLDSSLRTKMVRVGQAAHHYLNLQLRFLVVVKDGTD